MNLKTFIDRPILSVAISTFLVLVGIIALAILPIEQYPDIAPPTIRVSTTYSGANATAVQNAVIAPLEEAINGVEDMTYMTSEASNSGSASITVYFKQGIDPDMAAVNVQNRVSRATSLLPAEVTRVGVEVSKRQSSTLKVFALVSPDSTYDETFLTNYLSINVKPQIQRISGVGDCNVMGGDYAMRVWMKPDVMAQYGLIPSDVSAALSSQNIEASTGAIGENSDNVFQYTLRYKGRLSTEEEFGEIVIRAYDDGRVLKLKDIADIELGAVSYNFEGRVKGAPGVTCMINQTAGSNANEIIKEIDAYLETVKADLPKGIEIIDIMSTKDPRRIYPRSDKDPVRDDSARGAGGVYLPAEPEGYPHPYDMYLRRADCDIRIHDSGRLHHQPDHPLRADPGYRYGRGRCHNSRRGGAGTLRHGLQVCI